MFSCETQRHLLGVLANYHIPNNWNVECSKKTLLLFIYKHSNFQLQWNPLNVISDNVIIRLMLSNWPRLTKCHITEGNWSHYPNDNKIWIDSIPIQLWKPQMGLCQINHINWLITLSVITLSGFHCSFFHWLFYNFKTW